MVLAETDCRRGSVGCSIIPFELQTWTAWEKWPVIQAPYLVLFFSRGRKILSPTPHLQSHFECIDLCSLPLWTNYIIFLIVPNISKLWVMLKCPHFVKDKNMLMPCFCGGERQFLDFISLQLITFFYLGM